ncbi:hypothetical protein ABXN37_26370 [Piscinibacter sakaiensis]|uniref:hypothetical protein n=1 Tax=Piscinibacter sakaiensis TaxID=1547922 RepID=UPI00372A024A
MDISVLLPAPFSPTMPCTLPAATVSATSSLARTAPKCLRMPCSAPRRRPGLERARHRQAFAAM